MKVCIVSEGCYPIVRGGLSEWTHLLMRTLKDVQFEILCISPQENQPPLYEKLPNVGSFTIKALGVGSQEGSARLPGSVAARLVDLLEHAFLGEPLDFEHILELREMYPVNKGWLASRAYWDFVTSTYRKDYAGGSFVEYYWTIYGLCSLLLNIIGSADAIPRADVYHCLSTGFAGFVGGLAKARYGKPIVLTEQGLYLVERRTELARQNVSEWYRGQVNKFSESLVRTSYKYADTIVPPCRSHVPIEKELGADPARITVVRNGIECDRFNYAPVYKNGARPVVGCFARVVPVKSITTLIQAARLVVSKCNADFVVVGEIQDKEYHQQCVALVEKLGLSGNFRFTGHTDPVGWYHQVDVFTLSSISEGVPYALLEAMSCGLPSVCTAVGGVPEIIADGVGYVVPPGEPQLLADKLCELLQNRELRLELGRHANRVANEKYTIQEMAARFKNMYEGLANGRNRVQYAKAG